MTCLKKRGMNTILQTIQASMGGAKDAKASIDIVEKKRNGRIKVVDHPFPKYLSQLPRKLQLSLQSRLKKLAKDSECVSSAISSWKKEKGSSTALEVDLEKQLQAWRENPDWTDQPPEIKVSVPKGSLCNLNVKVNAGLPPDAVYNIVIDPDNRRVFKNIKEVVSRKVIFDDGTRQVVEVEQAALWNFLWWSGTISVHVIVDQNREYHTMKFKQVKTDYMEKFEGCWRAEPIFVDEKACFPFKPKTWEEYYSCTKGKGRIGSRLSLEQLIQPAIVPPPPLSWYLRGITAKTTEMLVSDLLAETARIRGGFNDATPVQGLQTGQPKFDGERIVDEICDIKERWAARRRLSRKLQRRKMILKQS